MFFVFCFLFFFVFFVLFFVFFVLLILSEQLHNLFCFMFLIVFCFLFCFMFFVLFFVFYLFFCFNSSCTTPPLLPPRSHYFTTSFTLSSSFPPSPSSHPISSHLLLSSPINSWNLSFSFISCHHHPLPPLPPAPNPVSTGTLRPSTSSKSWVLFFWSSNYEFD